METQCTPKSCDQTYKPGVTKAPARSEKQTEEDSEAIRGTV